MKKIVKILLTAAVLCVLAATLGIAISANTETNDKYIVNGVGFKDINDAILAADNTYIIYLNDDVTLDSSVTISVKVKF